MTTDNNAAYILVSGNIKFMQIFLGCYGKRALNTGRGLSKMVMIWISLSL